MEQTKIYLCYQTDVWHSGASKRLVYIGDDMWDCVAQLGKEFNLNEKHEQQLRDDHQTRGIGTYELLIEEERLNCFSNNWN